MSVGPARGAGARPRVLPEARGIVPERARVRKALFNRGVDVFKGDFPTRQHVPQAMAGVRLELPFAPGAEVTVQQGNDTMKAHSSHGPYRFRNALDFVAAQGDSAGLRTAAAAGGTVYAFTGARVNTPDNWGFGNFVLVDMGNGYATLYGHLDKISVQTGQVVEAGQELGEVGMTGSAGNRHLHFQVVKLKRRPDPERESYQKDPDPNLDWLKQFKDQPDPPFSLEPVPYFMNAVDVTRGDTAEGHYRSTEFRGGEAKRLPEYAHVYERAAS